MEAGDQVVIGTTILEVGYYTPPDAALTLAEDGAFLDYNRPPRILPPERQDHASSCRRPVKDEHKRPFPIVMLVLPMMGAVLMAVMMGRPQYLMMAAMSPMMMLGNFWQEKKTGKKTFAQQVADYEAKKARIEQDAREALSLERTPGARRARTRRRCWTSASARASGCGSGAGATPTTCCCGSAPWTRTPRSCWRTPSRTSTGATSPGPSRRRR